MSVGSNDYVGRFVKTEKIGEGTYGKVYKAQDRHSGEVVALKRVAMDDEGVPALVLREISILKQLNHKNVVSLLDVVILDTIAQPCLYLAFEYIDMDLHQFTKARRHSGGLGSELVRSFTRQLCEGMHYCHTHRVLHRDLKPQNVLIEVRGGRGGENGHDLVLKLADFGLARAFTMPLRVYSHEVVTIWYRPPEVLLGAQEYSTALDMWAVGAIFAELSNGAPLFPGESEIGELLLIFRKLGTPTDDNWPGVTALPYYQAVFPQWAQVPWARLCPKLCENGRDLVARLLTYQPAARISAQRALQHAYFAGTGVRSGTMRNGNAGGGIGGGGSSSSSSSSSSCNSNNSNRNARLFTSATPAAVAAAADTPAETSRANGSAMSFVAAAPPPPAAVILNDQPHVDCPDTSSAAQATSRAAPSISRAQDDNELHLQGEDLMDTKE